MIRAALTWFIADGDLSEVSLAIIGAVSLAGIVVQWVVMP